MFTENKPDRWMQNKCILASKKERDTASFIQEKCRNGGVWIPQFLLISYLGNQNQDGA